LGVCRHYRLGHSQFLAWSDDDQDKALAFERRRQVRQGALCPSCGTEPSDWVDSTGRRLAEPAWIVETTSCQGCDEIDAARSQIGDQERHRVHVRLRPTTPGDFIDLG